ncbi:synaptic vesicle membrane protein VAT-1 homolog [Schistocerca gregaria]|uniref:synaptic vesicle membrane protein VAT-1 homolog n=1 Tax=Schistocerca gregaria TaxID=7010 RepID=UPI00211E713D|nr:synaptic vesicle membrane protein VAT-1 homolog [Schistocerca gregaria]
MGTFFAGQDDRVIDEDGNLDAILKQRRGRDYDSEVDDETETGAQVEAAAEVYSQTNESRQRPPWSRQSSSSQVSRVTSPMFEEDHKGDINPILSFLRSMKEEADEQRKNGKEEAEKQRRKEKQEDYDQRKKDKEEGDDQRKKEKEKADEQSMANPVSGVSVRRSENSEAVS